jgi:hypothetical protein
LEDAENILIEERSKKLKEFDEKYFSEQHYLYFFLIFKI